jgi:hypothetical protein
VNAGLFIFPRTPKKPCHIGLSKPPNIAFDRLLRLSTPRDWPIKNLEGGRIPPSVLSFENMGLLRM